MKRREHPTFALGFIKWFLVAFASLAASFFSAFHFYGNGEPTVGMACVIAFVGIGLATVVFFICRMYFVRCPTCGGRTRTLRDRSEQWQAECEACQIRWDLGVDGSA